MILDGIIIIFLIFSAFSGYKKGLTTIIISLSGFIIAVILAFIFKSSLVNFVIETTNVDITMKQFIGKGIDKAIQSKFDVTNTQNNSFYTSIVENMGVNETVDNLSSNVVKFILETAAFILIFLAVITCAFIIQMMLNVAFDLPILTSINSIGGVGIGVLMGLFKIWIVLAIVSMIIPMFGQLKTLIDSSIITKMLYDTNILVKLLSSGLKF
ncbi:MAG: CvpA family protein [Clostridia bacterium]|nr:CvpA family protein [Clostridia bacterium]MDD4387198.1 CvpA family protein [Clostridia bacterium]